MGERNPGDAGSPEVGLPSAAFSLQPPFPRNTFWGTAAMAPPPNGTRAGNSGCPTVCCHASLIYVVRASFELVHVCLQSCTASLHIMQLSAATTCNIFSTYFRPDAGCHQRVHFVLCNDRTVVPTTVHVALLLTEKDIHGTHFDSDNSTVLTA